MERVEPRGADRERWVKLGCEPPSCPMCHGAGVSLGALGDLNHYKCRDCGMYFHDERSMR